MSLRSQYIAVVAISDKNVSVINVLSTPAITGKRNR